MQPALVPVLSGEIEWSPCRSIRPHSGYLTWCCSATAFSASCCSYVFHGAPPIADPPCMSVSRPTLSPSSACVRAGIRRCSSPRYAAGQPLVSLCLVSIVYPLRRYRMAEVTTSRGNEMMIVWESQLTCLLPTHPQTLRVGCQGRHCECFKRLWITVDATHNKQSHHHRHWNKSRG